MKTGRCEEGRELYRALHVEVRRGGGSRTAATGSVVVGGPLSNLPGVIETTGGGRSKCQLSLSTQPQLRNHISISNCKNQKPTTTASFSMLVQNADFFL